MSIASEITSIGENLKKDYQAIANLGADLTNVDKNIENIAELLDGVYDNLPKTEYQEGTEINLGKTIKGKLDYDNGVVGFGQASQESTTGKNLFNVVDLRDYNATSNDATITKKINEISFVSGSSNTSGFYTSKSYWSNYIQNYVEGTAYKVSADIVASQNTTIKFGNDGTTPVSVAANTKTRLSFDLTAAAIVCYNTNQTSGITITVSNIMFSTSNDTTYEHYTGGYSSPSPNWEQEVKCVAGRNKLKVDFEAVSVNGIDFSSSEEEITITGTTTASANTIVGQTTLPKGSYTLSCTNMAYAWGTSRIEVSGTGIDTLSFFSGTLVRQLTLSQETALTFRAIVSGVGTSVNYKTKIQVEEGSVAHNWLPYNTIEEVVSGKNLFEPTLTNEGTTITRNNVSSISVNDGEFTFVASGSDMYFGNVIATGGSYANERGIKIYRNGNEKISYKCTNNLFAKNYICAFDSDGISLGYSGTLSYEGTYTFPNNCEYITFRFGKGDAVSGTTYKTKVIVAYGDEIPDYEPYKTPKTYQFSLGDHKFYGIGNYKDELIYDVENDKVYKNEKIGKVVFNGSEGWTQTGARQDTFYLPQDFFSQYLYPVQYLYSNIAKFNKYITSTGEIDETGSYIYVNGSAGYVYFQFPNISTLTEFKNIIQNSLAIYIQEPVLTEITDTTLKAQVKAWYYGQSLDGTTIIEGNGDLPMIIKVRGLKGE